MQVSYDVYPESPGLFYLGNYEGCRLPLVAHDGRARRVEYRVRRCRDWILRDRRDGIRGFREFCPRRSHPVPPERGDDWTEARIRPKMTYLDQILRLVDPTNA